MALVQYYGKNILNIGLKKDTVMILPGINELTPEQVEQVNSHPLFRARVERKIMKILDEPNSKDGKRSVQEMLEYIPQMVDKKLLRKLIDNDGRKEVVGAAQEQLDKIINPSKYQEQKDNDEHFR